MSVLQVNTINEVTSANGVTIDGLSLKDGNVVPANGKGIDFSAVTSGGNFTADSNLLDDYEHGDFEIVLSGSTSGTLTLHSTYKYGTYTRIGNLVHVNGYANVDGAGSANGNIMLNLPYPTSNNTKYKASGSAHLWSVNSEVGAFLIVEGSSTAMLVNFTYSGINNTNFSGDEEIAFALTYNVD